MEMRDFYACTCTIKETTAIMATAHKVPETTATNNFARVQKPAKGFEMKQNAGRKIYLIRKVLQ